MPQAVLAQSGDTEPAPVGILGWIRLLDAGVLVDGWVSPVRELNVPAVVDPVGVIQIGLLRVAS